MQAGLYWGYVDMVEGLVRRMTAELGGKATRHRHRRPGVGRRARDHPHQARGRGAHVEGPAPGLGTQSVIDVESYCREIEAYLCRKNDGHLIRVVGPAFEHVIGVGAAGYSAARRRSGRRSLLRALLSQGAAPPTGSHRVLRSRRARCIRSLASCGRGRHGRARRGRRPACRGSAGRSASQPKRSLAGHLESLVARLTILRGSDKARPRSVRRLTGDARHRRDCVPRRRRQEVRRARRCLSRLSEIDRALIGEATSALSAKNSQAIEREALGDVEAFRSRMPVDAFERACRAARDRLVRHHFSLPEIEM